jgi:hypothetical protein
MGETTKPPTITGLADLRPGDLLFTNIGGLVPGVFPVGLGQLVLGERVRIGRLTFDHVGVVTDAATAWPEGVPRPDSGLRPKGPMLVQAMPRGAERIEMTAGRHWTDRCAYARIPEDYPEQALDVAAIARAMAVGDVPYSFGSYVLLAAWRYGLKAKALEARIDRRRPAQPLLMPSTGEWRHLRLPAEAICSVLADQAWTLAGKRVVEGVAAQCVTPGKLAMQLWRRPGVIWGGPGILG